MSRRPLVNVVGGLALAGLGVAAWDATRPVLTWHRPAAASLVVGPERALALVQVRRSFRLQGLLFQTGEAPRKSFLKVLELDPETLKVRGDAFVFEGPCVQPGRAQPFALGQEVYLRAEGADAAGPQVLRWDGTRFVVLGGPEASKVLAEAGAPKGEAAALQAGMEAAGGGSLQVAFGDDGQGEGSARWGGRRVTLSSKLAGTTYQVRLTPGRDAGPAASGEAGAGSGAAEAARAIPLHKVDADQITLSAEQYREQREGCP